jgi:tetratricopeptide (TPR) repeat protein
MRVFLQASDPRHQYEVINVGGVSYASYRVVNLMKEMIRYKPDLFIVDVGHNEFLEERTYGEIRDEPAARAGLRSTLHTLKTYGLLRELLEPLSGSSGKEAEQRFVMTGEVKALLDQAAGIGRYHRDSVQTSMIYRHFRANLRRMAALAEEHGVALLFVVCASNEKDFSPFKSEIAVHFTPGQSSDWNRTNDRAMRSLAAGKREEALQDLNDLAGRDPGHAEVRFLRGGVLLELGRREEAKTEFVAAIDEDIAPLRATSRIRQDIREVAKERALPLFDVPQLLEKIQFEARGHTCLGAEFLYDHCHPTIETHRLIAGEIIRTARSAIPFFQEVDWREYDEEALSDSVLASLGDEYFSLRNLNLAKVLRWAGKRKEAGVFVRMAAHDLPTHPEAQYLLGLDYQERGKFDSADVALQRAISLDPTNANALNSLGSVNLRQSRYGDAVSFFRKAIALHSGIPGVHYNLGNAFAGLGEIDSALQAYRSELAINPDHAMTLNNLGVLHMNRREFSIATPFFRRVLQLDPTNVGAYSNLGVIAFAEGRFDDSRAMFREVLHIDPGDRFAREWLNRLERQEGRRQ